MQELNVLRTPATARRVTLDRDRSISHKFRRPEDHTWQESGGVEKLEKSLNGGKVCEPENVYER